MNDHENSAPRRFDWREFPFMLLPIALLVSIRIKMLPFVGVPNCYNGDAAVANLMTRDLAHGTFTTIFYGQTYPGSIESFFALPFYKWVFGGPDLRGFACGQIVLLSLTLLAVYRIGHSLGGRLGALAGSLTLAIGTMQIFENMAGAHQSYIATMLLGSLLILVGAQLLKQATIRRAMLAGLITGLGMWTNPQILIFLAPILAVLFLRGQLCSLLHRGELGQVAGPRLMRTAKVLFALWLLLFWGILELALLGGFEYRFGDFHLSMTKHPKYMIRLVVLLCAGLGLFEFHLTTHKRRLVTLLACAGLTFGVGVSPLIKHRLEGLKPVKRVPAGINLTEIPQNAYRLFVDRSPSDPSGFVFVLFNRDNPLKLTGRQSQAYLVLKGVLMRAILVGLLGVLLLYRKRLWAMVTLRPPAVTYGTLLVLHAAGQLFFFLTFSGRVETRYLEALWIPYTALLAGIGGWLTRRHFVLGLVWIMLLLSYYGTAWADTYRYFSELPKSFSQQVPRLLEELDRRNVTRGYANFWVGYPLMYLSDEKVILNCYPGEQREDQHLRYKQIVERSPDKVFIFEDGQEIDQRVKRRLLREQLKKGRQFSDVWRYQQWEFYRIRQ